MKIRVGGLVFILLLILSRRAVPFSTIEIYIPDLYRPGHELPSTAKCSDNMYDYGVLYCASLDYSISFQYNRVSGKIDHTTVSVDQYRIGDFILAWGSPDGVMRYTPEITQVFWGVRSIWVVGKFIPQAKAILYEEYIEPPPTVRWEGFLDYNVFLTVR